MIALLARYISIAEGQRKRQVQTHSRTVAELLQLLEERMQLFTSEAEDNIARLKAQFEQELSSLKRVYANRIQTSEEIKQATINEEEELIDELRKDYAGKL